MPLLALLIKSLADKYHKSSAEIVLAWQLARFHVVIPESSKFERASENFDSQETKLEEIEVHAISKLKGNWRVDDIKKSGGEFVKVSMCE